MSHTQLCSSLLSRPCAAPECAGPGRGQTEAGGGQHSDQGQSDSQPGEAGQGPGDHVHSGGAPRHVTGKQELQQMWVDATYLLI